MVKKPSVEPVKEIKEDSVVVDNTIEVTEDNVTEIAIPKVEKEIETSNVTPLHNMGGGYIEFEGKLFNQQALKELRPDLFALRADSTQQISTNFGTHFPKIATKGDIFVRVDILPNRVYKFDGNKWIEINKETTDSYLYDQEYIKYLISKIDSGEYDVNLLNQQEEEQIREYLKSQNNLN